MNIPVIPTRFRQAIQIHILKNILRQDSASVPLFLGIHGRPGDGKTYQCMETLKDSGIGCLLMSGGQYENARSAEPSRQMNELYLEAGRLMATGEFRATALVLNDIDTGLGAWEGIVQYTVNRQNLLGALMHLSDAPTFVQGKETPRVPIIVTGNDFTKLYEPLRRSGRMDLFEWRSEPEERAEIVSNLFPSLTPSQSAQLVNAFPDQPVSFFSDVRSRLIDLVLREQLDRTGFAHAVNWSGSRTLSELMDYTDLSTLVGIGDALAASLNVHSHLEATR
ncbi:MAG: AAA family ATPase [Candidatus Dormibacteraceae bacterium]